MAMLTSYSVRVRQTFLLVWLAMLWGSAPSSASAASFDCARAKSAIEIAICANPKVSALDAQMGQAYRRAQAQLSESGQQLLRANQEQFLHSLSAICLSTDPLIVTHRTVEQYGSGLGPGAMPTDDCLASYIRARTKSDLSTAVQRVGGRTLLRLATNEVRRRQPSAAGTEDGRVSEESIALVQIDRPRTSAENTFNAHAQQLLGKAVCGIAGTACASGDRRELDDARKALAEAEADIGAEVSATMITDDVATVETDVGYYFPGAAHPVSQQDRALWSFALGRELNESDIFDPRKNWDSALSRYAQRHVRGTAYPPASKDSLLPIKSIASISNWQFERGGLRLIFGQYELGGYLSAAEAFLPWSVIGPYLKPHGAINRKAVERGPSKR